MYDTELYCISHLCSIDIDIDTTDNAEVLKIQLFSITEIEPQRMRFDGRQLSVGYLVTHELNL